MCSQADSILAALKAREPVTPLTALRRWGCFRLAARIAELRSAGHQIHTLTVPARGGKRVALYRLM